nr:cytochrome b6-f complex subunit 6 [Hypnea nidulans]WCH54510.1 cytochrome b6-f complex subunit 6 [Hypnea nidulans]
MISITFSYLLFITIFIALALGLFYGLQAIKLI